MTNRTPRPSGLRQMATILVVGIAARVAVLWILPPNAMSYDLRAWRSIVRFLAEGQNPYNVPQRFLSWPPAWMQIVFVLGSVARRLDVPVTVAIRVFLILSDALGLAVSLIGLVLTTQAATENSNFTKSAFAVLSSAGVGVVAGIVFYWWGQRQELQAAEGRRKVAVVKSEPVK